MFGGYGIYYGQAIIGVIVDNQLYFKIDELTKPDFEAAGGEQWIYESKTKQVAMPYIKLPESHLEQRDTLSLWIEKAYEASLRKKKAPQKKKPKKQLTS